MLLSKSLVNYTKIETPIVSVVVPAYKEEEYVEATLRGIVRTLRAAGLTSEIIVVLDLVPGDRTASHVGKVARTYSEIRVLERQGKRGVGDAVRTGIKEARGEIVVIAMGDQSEDPSDIVRLVNKAKDCDVVFANRFKHGKPLGYPVLKYVVNRCCNLAAMLLFRIPYSDTTNAFKAYRKALLDRIDLFSDGFEIFLEMPVKVMMFATQTDEIEVRHTVRRKEAPKLSILRDGYRYVGIMVSLLDRGNVTKRLGLR